MTRHSSFVSKILGTDFDRPLPPPAAAKAGMLLDAAPSSQPSPLECRALSLLKLRNTRGKKRTNPY